MRQGEAHYRVWRKTKDQRTGSQRRGGKNQRNVIPGNVREEDV